MKCSNKECQFTASNTQGCIYRAFPQEWCKYYIPSKSNPMELLDEYMKLSKEMGASEKTAKSFYDLIKAIITKLDEIDNV